MPPPPSLFIHSGWRSGGTYLWSKFRAAANTYCWYEPLFEGLGFITAADILSDRSAASLHHPLQAPHKLEFLPLISGRGMFGFPAEYSYGEYFISPDDAAPELAAYFQALTSHATDRAFSPVFGMVRSGLRLAWFKAHFPGCHIAVRRNPRQRWISYLLQAAEGNSYFMERGAIILGRNLDHPALAGLRTLIEFPDLGRDVGAEAAYQAHARTLGVPQHYLIFSYLQKLAQIEAERHADLLVDLDALTRDSQARAAIEQRISAETGISIDLSDCKLPLYDELVASWAPLYDPLDRLVDKALDIDQASEPAALKRQA